MTDHSAAVDAAGALIRDLAAATSDPRDAYAGHAELVSVTTSLHALAQHLEAALEHLARHIERNDGALPGQVARQAGGGIRSAEAEARNMVRALGRSVEALGRVGPPPPSAP
ncbi:hypothetical protein ABZ743_12395 [Streptomyces sp. NPDC006662]|uniref:hypothetical protein n=1 Tax=Streptomyces sp. NPDC006662 TaxID=3156902 RepID=UPI0033CC5649